MIARRLLAVLVAALLLLGVVGCDAHLGDWLGAADKPAPPPVTADILCDASSGSTCTTRTLRSVLEAALGDAAGRPGSIVRVWLQGRRVEDTRLIAEVGSAKPRGTGRRARAEYESTWIAASLASLTTAADAAIRKPAHRSPIAESMAVVAMAPAASKSTREVVVITDGMEVSDFGEFECGPLPKPERFARLLARREVLPPGSLAGIRIRFVATGLRPIDHGRCAASLARAAEIRTLWQTALQAAGASSVEIRQGGLDLIPTSNPGKDTSHASAL
jgi:hypothetical protein